MNKKALELAFEGGGVDIYQIAKGDKIVFQVHKNEFDPTDEIGGVNDKKSFDTFDLAFKSLHKNFQWYRFIYFVDDEHKEYIRNELMIYLMDRFMTLEEFDKYKLRTELALNIKINFGYAPILSGKQKITVYPLIKTTKYINGREASLFNSNIEVDDYNLLFEKHECWMEKSDFLKGEFSVNGKLEIKSNVIIIRYDNDLKTMIYPVNKYTVLAEPILNDRQSWYYTINQ